MWPSLHCFSSISVHWQDFGVPCEQFTWESEKDFLSSAVDLTSAFRGQPRAGDSPSHPSGPTCVLLLPEQGLASPGRSEHPSSAIWPALRPPRGWCPDPPVMLWSKPFPRQRYRFMVLLSTRCGRARRYPSAALGSWRRCEVTVHCVESIGKGRKAPFCCALCLCDTSLPVEVGTVLLF